MCLQNFPLELRLAIQQRPKTPTQSNSLYKTETSDPRQFYKTKTSEPLLIYKTMTMDPFPNL